MRSNGTSASWGASGAFVYNIFNPLNSAKTVYINSIQTYCTASTYEALWLTTADLASPTGTLLVTNFNSKGPSSVVNCSFLNLSAPAPTGTLVYGLGHIAAQWTSLLTNNQVVTLVPGTGLQLYYTTQGSSGAFYNCLCSGLEQ